MYFVFMKVPGMVLSTDGDTQIVAADYAVPEMYVKPAQDLDLYLAIKNESQNGFNTVDEAKAWAEDAMKRIYKFIHSTPRVRKEYNKCYVKIVDEESLTQNFMERVNRGVTNFDDIAKSNDATVGQAYPTYTKPYDGGETHITMDMSDLLDNFSFDEREELKKIHSANTRKPNFAKTWKKYDEEHYIDDDIFISYGYELEEARESKKKAIDNVPKFATTKVINDLGMKNQYFFTQRVGKWIEVRKMSMTDKSTDWNGSVDDSRYGFEYIEDKTFGVDGMKRWDASKTNIETIKKELCLANDETIIDLNDIEPFYKIGEVEYLHTIVKMYRFLLCTGNIVECEKYKKG